MRETFDSVPHVSGAKQVNEKMKDAFYGFLNYCESQQDIAIVIAKHRATHSELSEQYLNLLTNGGD